jgi:Bacterial Ig-like domain (group 2)
MPQAISTITQTLTNSPLPLLIEKLGLAIANAQSALDRNSIKMLNELSQTPVRIQDKDYNLLNLGFIPTFYAFTEASIEAKMEFSMSESTSFEVGGKVSVDTKVVAVSVSASYARKFEQSAEGSSSIAARLVSLPPPERFLQIIQENAQAAEVAITKITIQVTSPLKINEPVALTAGIEPSNATDKELVWSVSNALATISNGTLTGVTAGDVTLTAKAKNNPLLLATKVITVTN